MDTKRKVIFKQELELSLKKGIDILANAVKTTMGPKGKLVLIQRENKHPTITKDGITVANAINLEDEVQNLGVRVIREAASRTADQAGDGTTTSTVLAQAIFNEGLKMKSAGYQMDLLKDGVNIGLKTIKESLESQRKNITSIEELHQVAMISANGEKEVSDLIVSAIESSGKDGTIIVEQAKGFKSSLTVVDGFRLNRGFLSPYFVTNKNKMVCEFKKPLVLLADRDFGSIHDLMKPLELSLEVARPILVICNDLAGDALQGIVLNKTKGALRICAIKSPGHGNTRHEMMLDLQSIIGGTIITNSFDMSSFTNDDFGSCNKVLIHKDNTLIIANDDKKNKTSLDKRIEGIKKNLLEQFMLADEEIKVLKYRLQQLSGGISILRIGAATESELIERYDRVDDALNATKAASEEGILPGGGVALARCNDLLKNTIAATRNPDVKAGMEIMSRAIQEPFKQIIRNGNISPDNAYEKIINLDYNIGFDAKNNKFGNMYDLGIVDPFKVVRCAIENATSAALMLLNVDCCMIDIKDKNQE
jgi:chaperonin GroEL